jgi:hypothetical protein
MSHLTNRLMAAALLACLALPAAATEAVETVDIYTGDYTVDGGPVRSSFVVGVGMVDQGSAPATVAGVKED